MSNAQPRPGAMRDPDPLTIGAFLVGVAGSLAGIAAFLRDKRQEDRSKRLEDYKVRTILIRWRKAIEAQRNALLDLRRSLALSPQVGQARFRPKGTRALYLSEEGFRIYRRAMRELLRSSADVHDGAIAIAETLDDVRMQEFLIDEATDLQAVSANLAEGLISGELALDGMIEGCLACADRMIVVCLSIEDQIG